jgi:gliding motility-associated protein GldC
MPTTSTIRIDVESDEHGVAAIRWEADDAPEPGAQSANAMILALWDPDHRNALRIDLWTREMTVDDMNDFVFQTLLSLADTYRAATNDDAMMAEIKIFARQFAERASARERRADRRLMRGRHATGARSVGAHPRRRRQWPASLRYGTPSPAHPGAGRGPHRRPDVRAPRRPPGDAHGRRDRHPHRPRAGRDQRAVGADRLRRPRRPSGLARPRTRGRRRRSARRARGAQFPVWSSDGNRLAVIVADQAGVRVDVVDVANGSAVETVHREPGRSPIYLGWAPDDRLLAVLVGIPGGGLALDLVPTAGTAMGDLQAVRTLTEGAPFYWSWARTGRSLFVHVDVGSSRALAGITSVAAFEVREPLPEPIGFQSPALSSDDRFLAYARREPVGRSVVVRPNPDRPGGAFEPIVVPFRGTAALAWRPGRAQLAVQRSSEPSPHPYGPVDLVDAATGDVRRLTDDVVIASFWSPDGRYLATLSLVGGGGERTIQASATAGARAGAWRCPCRRSGRRFRSR